MIRIQMQCMKQARSLLSLLVDSIAECNVYVHSSCLKCEPVFLVERLLLSNKYSRTENYPSQGQTAAHMLILSSSIPAPCLKLPTSTLNSVKISLLLW